MPSAKSREFLCNFGNVKINFREFLREKNNFREFLVNIVGTLHVSCRK